VSNFFVLLKQFSQEGKQPSDFLLVDFLLVRISKNKEEKIMATKEKIENKKKQLEEAIDKEFPRRSEWDIRRLLKEGNVVDIKILLMKQMSYQNISPAWLIEHIEKNGYTIEMVFEHAKEAKAKQERIHRLILMCAEIQSLDRK